MACRGDGAGEAASCAEADQGGLYDNAVIQRFESERQSLAMMNHPANRDSLRCGIDS
jgi:hypothetical protein